MKGILRKVYQWTKSLILSALKREVEAVVYSCNVLVQTGILAIIMLSVCGLTQFLLQWFNITSISVLPISLFDQYSTLELVSICLSIGLIEEGMFRYLFYDCAFQKWLKMPMWLALVISAVFFGVVHLGNAAGLPSVVPVIPQVVGATAAGFWLVYLYNKFGLHMAILCHALYDFAAIMGDRGIEGIAMLTILVTIGLFALMYKTLVKVLSV